MQNVNSNLRSLENNYKPKRVPLYKFLFNISHYIEKTDFSRTHVTSGLNYYLKIRGDTMGILHGTMGILHGTMGILLPLSPVSYQQVINRGDGYSADSRFLMSKQNGKNNGIEKHHFDNPEGIPIGNGISIAAAGNPDDAPSEVQLYTKVPGTKFAARFSFRNPELLTDFIEQLIAYRRYVFPDAPEIDTNATIGDKND